MRAALIALAVALAFSGAEGRADVERRARELEARLMAPCCFSQQLSVHHSAAADEARQDIRRRLTAGEREEDIVSAYVRRYGGRILAVPPAAGFGRWLYLSPPLVLVASAALLFLAVRRFTRPASAQHNRCERDGGADTDASYEAQLEEQLHNLD